MTNNEIKKALEHNASKCKFYEDGYDDGLFESTLDLINRQKVTIERLEKENNDKERVYTNEYCLRKEWQRKCRELLEEKQNAKSKAIKEFAEKIKEYRNICPMNGKEYICMDIQEINNLVKEMTEVNENERA